MTPAELIVYTGLLIFIIGLILAGFFANINPVTANITAVSGSPGKFTASYTINGTSYTATISSSTNIVGTRTIYYSLFSKRSVRLNSTMGAYIAGLVMIVLPLLALGGLYLWPYLSKPSALSTVYYSQ